MNIFWHFLCCDFFWILFSIYFRGLFKFHFKLILNPYLRIIMSFGCLQKKWNSKKSEVEFFSDNILFISIDFILYGLILQIANLAVFLGILQRTRYVANKFLSSLIIIIQIIIVFDSLISLKRRFSFCFPLIFRRKQDMW